MKVTSEHDPLAPLGAVSPSRLLLATDFDGTLAPIVENRDAAEPLPSAVEALSRLLPRLCAIAVITGRGATDIRERLPLPGLRVIGDYGLETPTAEERASLERYNAAAHRLVADLDGVEVEAKPGSTSVHHRIRPELGTRLWRDLRPLAEGAGLRANIGRMTIEARPHRAGKATALESLIVEFRPGAVIFAGDDEGDRDALRLVSRLDIPHLAVAVLSAESPAGLARDSDLEVDGPEGMALLLSRLVTWSRRGGL